MSAVEAVSCKIETVGNLTEFDINSVILGEEYAIEHSKSETIKEDSGEAPKDDCTNVNVVSCETSENGEATSKQVLENGGSSNENVGCDTTGANGVDTSERDVNSLAPQVTLVEWEKLPDCDTPRVYLERLSNDIINKWRKSSTVELPNPDEPLRSFEERLKLYHSFLRSNYTLECPVCKKTFLQKSKIVRHVREVHLKLVSRPKAPPRPYKPRKPTLSRKLMKLKRLNVVNSPLLFSALASRAPLEYGPGWVAPAAEQLPEWMTPTAEQLPEWVTPAAEQLPEWVTPIAEQLPEWVAPAAEQLPEWVPPGVQQLPEWVAPVVVKVESCQTLEATDIETALRNIKLGLEILEESDPNRDRSSATARRINDSIQCYKDLRRQLNKLNGATEPQ